MGHANLSLSQLMVIRVSRLLALFLLAACADASPLAPGMKAVEQIRGRNFVHDVRNVTIDRSELSKHLLEQMQRTTPYPMEQWTTVLRALQLVDLPGSEVMPKLLSLYESQVLAFYDPHTHTFYSIRQLPELPPEVTKVADPETLTEPVRIHELMHALQDQVFGLSEREKALMTDTDANLAYHAVLEGEAVLVMMAHMLGKAGVDVDQAFRDEAMRGLIASSAQADAMIDPSTPRYFAEMLKFPYLQGVEFVLEAYRQGGWKALDALHANPPRSTREILHPEEYRARGSAEPARKIARPEGALAAESLGEFHWRFLVGPAASRGLVEDRAVVFRDGRVEVETRWDRPEQAAAFAAAYRTFLEKRGVAGVSVEQDAAAVRAAYRWK